MEGETIPLAEHQEAIAMLEERHQAERAELHEQMRLLSDRAASAAYERDANKRAVSILQHQRDQMRAQLNAAENAAAAAITAQSGDETDGA